MEEALLIQELEQHTNQNSPIRALGWGGLASGSASSAAGIVFE